MGEATVSRPIHTLNARGNIMLEVLRDTYALDPAQMHSLIQALRREIEEKLAAKNIRYDELKGALIPDRTRREVALVFDTYRIADGWYGADIFRQLIPLLDPRNSSSILVGDYIDLRGDRQGELLAALNAAVRLVRDVEYQHSSQFFIIYLNNLSDAMVDRIDTGLRSYQPYVGFADTTLSSPFKLYLSTILTNLGVKHGSIIIQGHEPDRDDGDDVNTSGYPFEEFGYVCRSINGDLEGVLLAYKIERPVFEGFEVDTEFALNSVGGNTASLDDFDVQVEDAKLAYLRREKAGSLERAGLLDLSAEHLAALIKAKVSSSYIYSISADHEHGVTKFNVIIEVGEGKRATRLLAALQYKPSERILRLITLF